MSFRFWLPILLGLLETLPAGASDGEWVELKRLDPSLVIDLPYATEDNFCGEKLYPVARCFLRRRVAEALVAAHRRLGEQGLGLKVWDGYRPHSRKGETGSGKRGNGVRERNPYLTSGRV